MGTRLKARLARMVRFVALAGSISLLGITASALADAPGTATRLHAEDTQQLFPVAVYDRDTIERSGHVMLADFLRGTVFNSGGSFRPQALNTAQSFAGYSSWALGERRNIILINGRRITNAPNVGSAQDLNAIPLAMVERIEILPLAPTAVHGADAMSGVINIITRSDFEGAEIMLGASEPTREGGETAEFSALMGVSGDRGNITFGVSREYREIVWQRDREWSSGQTSLFANNFLRFPLQGAYYENPTNGAVVPEQGCTGENFSTTTIIIGGMVNPRPMDACVYEYSAVASDDVEIATQSLFTQGELALDEDWTAYFDARVSRVESFGRFAPAPGTRMPQLDAGSPNHPATTPANGGLNPEWQDYTDVAGTDLWLLHRFAGLDPRDEVTDNNNYALDLGVKGRLGEVDLQFGVRHQESKYIEFGKNRIVTSIAQSFVENGTYNIYDPYGVSNDVANSITATTNREAVYASKEVYLDAGMPIFELAGGMAHVVFGGEYREIDFHDTFDTLSESGEVIQPGTPSKDGGRNVKSFFGEAALPLSEALDLNLALRYDGYSDVGNAVGARIALGYDWTDSLYLRAQLSRAPNAPSIDYLARSPEFVVPDVVHGPSTICPSLPPCFNDIVAWEVANPDLGVEESDQLSLGFVFEPADGFRLSLDYQDIRITDRIRLYGPQEVINCLESGGCPHGVSFFDPNAIPPNPEAGLGAQFLNGPGTPITYIQFGYANAGTLDVETLALAAHASFGVGGGVLRHELRMSQLLSYAYGSADNVGEYGLPERRINLRNTYDFASFSASWNLSYIAAQDISAGGGISGVDDWLTHDVQLAYALPWNARVAVGAINVTDEDPPLDIFEERGYNFSLFNGYGRVPYLRYTQSF